MLARNLNARLLSLLLLATRGLGLLLSPVIVFKTKEAVASALCRDVLAVGAAAIASRGKFTLAVPGGSVLKMLGHLQAQPDKDAIDWSKVFLYYVNHKIVPGDDPSSTHFKAEGLFIKALGLPMCNVAQLASASNGAMGHDSAAHDYQKQIALHVATKGSTGLPQFDYMLLGMGADGHIGSLYPGRREVLSSTTSEHVLTVDKKQPASITLSLPVMNAAREIRMVLVGADKKEAALIGVTKSKAPGQFPVCGIEGAKWMLDEDAGRLCVERQVPGLQRVG